jgi:hypothetical protein
MEFNKAYNRQEFMKFLQNSFLPNDFLPTEEKITFSTQMKYTTEAVKLGSSETLDLVVYEIKHTSHHDARVSLSKEAFRLLNEEVEDRALIVFVPEDNNDNYRFSFIEITLDIAAEGGHRISKGYSNPRRYSYFLGEGISYYTPNKYLNEKGRVVNDEDLHSRFSVEVLTKEFYNELSDWYAWAIKIIRFPNDINDDTDDAKYNNEGAIRLITRLIFVWFLKQRHLIPEEFFDERYIANNLIEGFDPHAIVTLFGKSYEGKYYKAILQNLFFAMLNSPITAEGSTELSERHFRNGRGDYDNNKLMRYEDYFSNPQLFVDIANKTVPFLNGGLFDCLDDKDNGMYYDGFSDRDTVRKSLVVPDFLFFGDEAGKNIDLSEWYGDKNKKKVSARGIIDILKRYNFTVKENTPFDKEVSLDPELLGKVFENLLASFNPETQTTARKQTGSFYTPREIVQYMVNESLVAHLKRTVGEELEPKFRQLIQYTDEQVELTDGQRKQIMQSLYDCKILDPACGSGAFPMGILQQMVHILGRIDPDNVQWKDMMMNQAIDETSEAYRNASKEERGELITDIERSFDESVNRPDYARKLYLIENCIYGVDIQPIAIQISKLRFFISLVVDQNTNNNPTDNFGIRPLPNLEAKFVAANTLIGLNKKDVSLFDTDSIKAKENELKIANHKIFGAKTARTKRKWRDRVNELRQEIADMLKDCGAIGNAEAQQLTGWDMFNQNASSPFFDSEWMYGVKGGFDIVIGNPPYVFARNSKSKGMTANEKKFYYDNFKLAKYQINLYHLFIERGCNLLNDKGIFAYIIPNNWLTINTNKDLREYILNMSAVIVVNFYKRVFETADVDSSILIFNNSTTKKNIMLFESVEKNKIDLIHKCDCIEFLSKKDSIINIESFKNNAFVAILDIIEENSSELKEIADVKAGLQAYEVGKATPICTKEMKDNRIYHSMKKLDKTYYQYLQGVDVCRYSLNWSGEYLKYGNNLAAPRKFNLYSTPRILVRQIPSKPPYCINACYTDEILLNDRNSMNIVNIKYNPLFLLGMLNSLLVSFWFVHKLGKMQRGLFPQFKINELASFPIPKISKNQQQPIITLVEEILAAKKQNPQADTAKQEQEIDLLVYKLYGLTYDEVKIVDPKTPITKEEYE